jgi:hypothetical protein
MASLTAFTTMSSIDLFGVGQSLPHELHKGVGQSFPHELQSGVGQSLPHELHKGVGQSSAAIKEAFTHC